MKPDQQKFMKLALVLLLVVFFVNIFMMGKIDWDLVATTTIIYAIVLPAVLVLAMILLGQKRAKKLMDF